MTAGRILAIDRRLRAARIPIGLPQRDVRLRDDAPATPAGAAPAQ